MSNAFGESGYLDQSATECLCGRYHEVQRAVWVFGRAPRHYTELAGSADNLRKLRNQIEPYSLRRNAAATRVLQGRERGRAKEFIGPTPFNDRSCPHAQQFLRRLHQARKRIEDGCSRDRLHQDKQDCRDTIGKLQADMERSPVLKKALASMPRSIEENWPDARADELLELPMMVMTYASVRASLLPPGWQELRSVDEVLGLYWRARQGFAYLPDDLANHYWRFVKIETCARFSHRLIVSMAPREHLARNYDIGTLVRNNELGFGLLSCVEQGAHSNTRLMHAGLELACISENSTLMHAFWTKLAEREEFAQLDRAPARGFAPIGEDPLMRPLLERLTSKGEFKVW